MIYAFLLALSIVLSVCKSAVYNRYAKSMKPDSGGIFSFNAASYGVAAIIALICGVGSSMSPFTLAMAFCYAAVVFSLQALSVAAMVKGPMSLTSLFVLYGMIIPSLAGPIFWKEPFGFGQAAGILLILVSIWLLCAKDYVNTPPDVKWSVMVGICFLLSGTAGVIEKIHQTSAVKDELMMFLFTACLVMFLMSVGGCLIYRIKVKKALESIKIAPYAKIVLLFGGLSGVIIGFYSRINLTLSGKLDSLIYYPVANGGALMLTVLVSVMIFHEKLTKRRLVGFILGLLAIILLSIPKNS